MLIPVRWLNEVFQSGLSVDELSHVLTMSGLEVEGATDLGMKSGKIVVGRVIEVQKHPDADKLSVTRVDVGDKSGGPLGIVCGAPNVRKDMLVPTALIGADLPNSMKIARTKIRGQESEGMLCSAKELGLGSDHSGILELPDTYKVGEPFDYIFDLKITPNRGDCLSVLGVAREVAAMTGKKIFTEMKRFSETMEKTDQYLNVTVRARRACPRYTARYISDVKVGESPLWIKRRLESMGLRPIGNIVDITNYVMLELGIPLHAFDHDRIQGGEIVVRYAEEGEKFTTLDGRELTLHPEDLVIADQARPIALAGVMGGKNTEVTDSTTNIALECANFDPVSIRKTARRHNISTDSSYRFERGTDKQKITVSLNRATQLIQKYADGDVAKGILDDQGGVKRDDPPVQLEIEKVNNLLGLRLSNADVADRLLHLGFEILRSDRSTLTIARPSYRSDIVLDVDLIEEVARITGYDKIPATMPAIRASDEARDRDDVAMLRGLRDILVGLGFTEALNFTWGSEELFDTFGHDSKSQPHVANPLSQEQAVLRPALLPELLHTVRYNERQGEHWCAMFEIGKTYVANARPGHAEDEYLSLALAMTGTPPHNWTAADREFDFYDLKGALESLGEAIGLGQPEVVPLEDDAMLHPGRAAALRWQGAEVGTFGEIHPDLADRLDVRGRIYCAELDLDKLLRLMAARHRKFQPIPRLPSSERDLAVVVDRELPAGKILEAARAAGKKSVEEITIIDVYKGEHVAQDKKSVTLHVRLTPSETTLTEEEIHEQMSRILRKLEKDCGAALRS